ncbi:MAG: LacI family transcriptional regulator [Chloroflexi bacterium]|nr:LacI family transcriptional regulator [Chloroflexota bacterium]
MPASMDSKRGRVTIADVARVAGVSVGTVSHVFNDKPVVAPATRQRVLTAAQSLGFSPDDLGRALSLGHTRTIALCGPIATNLSISGNIHAASQCASRAGYGLVCCSTDNDPQRELAILEMLTAHKVAAAITHGAIPDPAPYRRLQDAGIAVVFTRHRPPGIAADLVVSDYYDGTLRASRHLLEIGRRRIALLAGALRDEPTAARLEAYRRAHAEAGVAVYPELLRPDLNDSAAGFAAVADLLQGAHAPDAILAIGRRSVELALQCLAAGAKSLPPREVFLPVELALRESTMPLSPSASPSLPAQALT